MAEERSDPNPIIPLSERDLAPIELLTPGQILNIGQRYVQASFNQQRLGRIVEANTKRLDDEVLDELQYQTGRRDALQEVLEELGQDKLISMADERVSQIFEQS